MQLEILEWPHEALKKVSRPLEAEEINQDLWVFGVAMLKAMAESPIPAVGLAAPQVGRNIQMFVIDTRFKEGGTLEWFINPKIIKESGSQTDKEGCLSFPDRFIDVTRPTTIKVKYRDLTGKKRRATLTGYEAKVFSHEYQHLQGITLYDHGLK